jgi:hypothetical protein
MVIYTKFPFSPQSWPEHEKRRGAAQRGRERTRLIYSKLPSIQDREDKRMATKQYKEYGEEPCSVADEGIGLNAT